MEMFWLFHSSTIYESCCLDINAIISSFSVLNISVNTIFKYYVNQSVNDKLKLIGGSIKHFFKNVTVKWNI